MLLNEYKLSLPKISMDDWLQAVESASGLIRDVLSAQTSGVRLLKTVKETKASTERIGWLNIWSKAFAALEITTAAITHRSKLGLLFCQRNTFELTLQMNTVLDPLQNRKRKASEDPCPKSSEEYALRSCIDRLRAYTAWCLWHDKTYYNELIYHKNMRAVWDFDFFRTMQNNANLPSQMERFLEKIESTLDKEAFREIGRGVRNMYAEKIKQIDEWLVDPRLRKWADAIDQARRRNSTGVPFFALFDVSETSIPKRLIKEGTRFSYPSYILTSIASHGSSMQEFIQIEGDTIKPVLTGDDEQINALASEVIYRCQQMFTILQTLNDAMINNPQIRS